MKPVVSESDFQRTVIEYARLNGWLVAHFRPGLTKTGRWSTAMSGDAGFPDLCMTRRGRVVFAELKRVGGKPTTMQATWLAVLGECDGVESYLWTPDSWNEIEDVLGRPAAERAS